MCAERICSPPLHARRTPAPRASPPSPQAKRPRPTPSRRILWDASRSGQGTALGWRKWEESGQTCGVVGRRNGWAIGSGGGGGNDLKGHETTTTRGRELTLASLFYRPIMIITKADRRTIYENLFKGTLRPLAPGRPALAHLLPTRSQRESLSLRRTTTRLLTSSSPSRTST